jgi:hypothetical protein
MLNRYLIIDDFYSNPDEIVKVALESPKEEGTPDGHERGLITTKFFLGQPLRELFQKLTLENSIASSTNANGRILFSQSADTVGFQVHCDFRMNTVWTGVIYLSREHPEDVEGTCFWKHLRTGLEVAPTTADGLARYGWSSFDELDTCMETEGRDESLWEKTLTVPYRFNRLVLFRPWQFHSHGPAFGDSLESARKVQTLYFGNPQPDQQW